MSPHEKVYNRVPIQNTLTFCHTTRLINMFIKIEYSNNRNEVIVLQNVGYFLKSYFFKWTQYCFLQTTRPNCTPTACEVHRKHTWLPYITPNGVRMAREV